MAMTSSEKKLVKDAIANSLRRKFQNYCPETSHMPFHARLLGKDRMALFSFIHSLNTTFGTSIFEPVAVALATANFESAKSHQVVGDKITDKAQRAIQDIMDALSAVSVKPDKNEEIAKIRQVAAAGEARKVKLTLADVFLTDKKGEIFLFDIKTAKPNKGGFKEYKRTLLEWVAATLYKNPKAKVNTLVAIPYNPYEPKPYERWTIAGMYDLPRELKVAAEFWDFLAGKPVYENLLQCFEEVGIEMRQEIDNHFARFRQQ